jgi:hypothetical protein
MAVEFGACDGRGIAPLALSTHLAVFAHKVAPLQVPPYQNDKSAAGRALHNIASHYLCYFHIAFSRTAHLCLKGVVCEPLVLVQLRSKYCGGHKRDDKWAIKGYSTLTCLPFG